MTVPKEIPERPGAFPFSRGTSEAGPSVDGWFHTYYSGAGTAKDTNHLFKDRFASGTPSLLLAMDLPTQVGLDPDDELSIGEVGRIGVAVSSLKDITDVFDGLRLSEITSGTVGNSIGIYTCPLFELAGQKQGVNSRHMQITLQNDPLKEFTGRGTQIFPIDVAVELSIDVVEYATRLGANWKPQYTCSTQMRWGGVSAAQEIGFGLSNMLEYVRALQHRELDLTEYLRMTDFHMSADEDLLSEVAKFRAARRAWALLLRDKFGAAIAEACPLRITVFTAGNRLTAQRPMNNIVRTTTHILAAMLGGVEELLVPAYDEALGLPTREATQLTNATKQILHYETGIGRSVDPLGGSEVIERLTDELTEESLYWVKQIDDAGGMIAAIASGVIDDAMTSGMLDRQLEIESGDRKIIGLNFGDVGEAAPLEVFQGNSEAERDQLQRMAALRQMRSKAEVQNALNALVTGAKRKSRDASYNLIPDVALCLESLCSIGEVFGVLREILGQAEILGRQPERQTGTLRMPRVVLAKPGLDGHESGVKLVARGLRGRGFRGHLSGASPESKRYRHYRRPGGRRCDRNQRAHWQPSRSL